jgi:RNA polymerase sigma-70 factor (ECF subfamily)
METVNKTFSLIYKEYWKSIYSFLMKRTYGDSELSKELCQQTFFSCYLNINQFDEKRRLISWLFGIANHKLVDYYRQMLKEKKYENEPNIFLDSMGSKINSPDKDFDNKILRQILKQSIAGLSDRQKEVFLLREFKNLNFKEISKMTKSGINTTLGRMRLARTKLCKELNEEYSSLN